MRNSFRPVVPRAQYVTVCGAHSSSVIWLVVMRAQVALLDEANVENQNNPKLLLGNPVQAKYLVKNNQPRSGHSKALPVHVIDFSKPGRLRVGHLLTLFSTSHSTLYEHMGTRYPAPDGKDGGRPYWKTSTIKDFLEGV